MRYQRSNIAFNLNFQRLDIREALLGADEAQKLHLEGSTVEVYGLTDEVCFKACALLILADCGAQTDIGNAAEQLIAVLALHLVDACTGYGG